MNSAGNPATGIAIDPYDQTDLELLIERIARERSEDAFRTLFAIVSPRIKGFMRRGGADNATADDLAQETMMMVWRKASMFNAQKGKAAGWIFTIARNLRIDRFRRERVWSSIPEEHENLASDEPMPDDVLSSKERADRLSQSLAQLPEKQLEVVKLSFLSGLSHSEISARLAIPIGTVKSRMRLAYAQLKEVLSELR